MRILSIGELLWDVIGGREFLGGAPLNFSVSSRRLGNDVALVSAVGDDQRGALAIRSLEALGLDPHFIEIVPDQPTGISMIALDDSGSATFEIKRPAPFDFLNQDAVLSAALTIRPDWIYFGTLAQTYPRNEALLKRLLAAAPQAKCFYDMNLRSGHWDQGLVERLSRRASILKLNESEAESFFRLDRGSARFSLEESCRDWSRNHGRQVICITLGSRGCSIWLNDSLRTFAGFSVQVADTVGAGDAFSAAFLHGLELGWTIERAASFANALGALVASRAGATPAWTEEECLRLIESAGESAGTKNRTG